MKGRTPFKYLRKILRSKKHGNSQRYFQRKTMRINTNVTSLSAQRFTKLQSKNVGESQRKLSSGKRVTQASDDAASLSISSKTEAHLASKKQAIRSATDAISITQVAEGTLSTMQSMVTRIRELAIQAGTDTMSDTERSFLDGERLQLMREINRLAESTELNGKKLLNGKEGSLSIVVGTNNTSNDRISITLDDLAENTHSLGIYDVSFRNARQARFSMVKLDYALDSLSKSRAKLGALQNRFESSINNLSIGKENESAANSRLIDTDVAHETAVNVSSKLKHEMATGALALANVSKANVVKLIG